MTRRYALKCSEDCDFILAAQAHDFETMARAFEQYEECPNCGSDLVEAHCREPKMGFLKITAPVEELGKP